MRVMINKIANVFSNSELPKTFAIFYTVGFFLFLFPYTRQLFIAITPLSLIFVVLLLLIRHRKWSLGFVVFLIFVITSSYLIEVAGVKTGTVFGNYQYLEALGPKLFSTPPIIGINWFMLVYCSAATMDYISRTAGIRINPLFSIAGGALLMVTYDFIAEAAAPVMNMWRFTDGYPPFKNFIMWFVIALFYHSLFHVLKLKSGERAAVALFVIQILFFLAISLTVFTGVAK